MPKRIPEGELRAIREALPPAPQEATAQQIANALPVRVSMRTLQYRLRHLVDTGTVGRSGEGRWARYRRAVADGYTFESSGTCASGAVQAKEPGCSEMRTAPGGSTAPERWDGMLSPRGRSLFAYLSQHQPSRRPVAVRRRLLDTYRPGSTALIRKRERAQLPAPGAARTPAAALAYREPLELEVIWNSARLSGCAYGELEARRLLKFNRPAEGCQPSDAQILRNHRSAWRFLLSQPESLAIDRVTLCNLHAILAHNLLPDEAAAGRLVAFDARFGEVDAASGVAMAGTFQRMLDIAGAIDHPFEQAFFLLVQLPYLAPFQGLNDAVARLAANIPLLRAGLLPWTFVDVPAELFAAAVRGVVERSRVDLLRDVFLLGYSRSAQRHCAVGPTGAADPFRLEHDDALRAAVAELIRARVPSERVAEWLELWMQGRVADALQDRFARVVERELSGLREDNFARYPIDRAEYQAWRATWSAPERAAHPAFG